MKSLQTLIVLLLLCFSLTVQATEGGSGDPRYAIQNPPAYAMLGDLLIARPLLVVATVIGAGAFVVSLPFTALGGGIGDAGEALVVAPAKAAFVRCLGCTGEGFEQRE
ncbi:multidrug transporter [Pseudomonas fluorescens]|uniref:multidrug transporter n=1 Tax=Pseudomonas fluorescens TaxID=294 RepID=UPI001A9E9080|nr:multidrug transporter [Pseudomonas fluorescens]QTD33128.1 multidrug transporter [Pseudomonas fluorescens]